MLKSWYANNVSVNPMNESHTAFTAESSPSDCTLCSKNSFRFFGFSNLGTANTAPICAWRKGHRDEGQVDDTFGCGLQTRFIAEQPLKGSTRKSYFKLIAEE